MSVRRRSGFHHPRRRACRLTELEQRILRLYAAGMNRAQIGSRVGFSERTISHYLTIAKEKLGADTLVQAAVLALGGPVLFEDPGSEIAGEARSSMG
jgi:DNA-binding CsgD family transcriptional regulator